ncbi:MAG: hypothetical protein GXY88_09950 [Tissierellia bacterium]|nr:hypothetical protein [Tissierellia bacterium]
MDSLIAITVVCSIFAVGDLVSAKTKSILSMMFVSSVILLVGFWVGLPETIFEDAGLISLGSLMIAFLITHMGTLLSIEDLKKQWKTVVIALGAIIGIGIFLFIVGSPILGREYAVAAAPPISGGVIAAIIMGDAAKAKGLESIAVFTTLLVVTQGFLGLPVASLLLNKEAKRLLNNFRNNAVDNEAKAVEEVAATVNNPKKVKKKLIPPLPEELQTNYILLTKIGLVAILGFKIADLTNGVLNANVVCLLLGIIGREIGFLEENIMTKANALGLAMVGLMAVAFGNLTMATPQLLGSLIGPLVISLLLGLVGIIIFSGILGKVLGYSKEMAIAIGTSALFGFPGTYILSNEVANAVGETEEERKAILDEILPKMLVAGFITVTIASVILAGFMANLM